VKVESYLDIRYVEVSLYNVMLLFCKTNFATSLCFFPGNFFYAYNPSKSILMIVMILISVLLMM